MEITEVRVYLREHQDRKLKAYAAATFDKAFVVRDLRIIEGRKGLFVAMPSRKLRKTCSSCGHKNVMDSKFCNQCGSNIENRGGNEEKARAEHRDVAHPITTEFREYLQKIVIGAYEQKQSSVSAKEQPQAEQPGPEEQKQPQSSE